MSQKNSRKTEFSAPKTDKIENQLLVWANQARSEAGLGLLGYSQSLRDLARAHSRELSETRELSHISASGKSYTDRLVSARLYFAEHGENVAFSETFVAEFIHQSLMESPEHRENILDVNFDSLGIGVVQIPGRGYYVTQDFIRSLDIDDPPESERHTEKASGHEAALSPEQLLRITQKTQELVQSLRQDNNLPEFEFLEDANALAKKFAEQRAQGLPPPPLPASFKKIHILHLIVTGPTLKKIEPELGLFKYAISSSGGIGISFSRDDQYPGGAYTFVFLLFVQTDYAAMSSEERTRLVLDQIQHLRSQKDPPSLTLDQSLSEAAAEISRAMLIKVRRPYPLSEELRQYYIESYITYNPFQIPDKVTSFLRRSDLSRLGLGVAFRPDPGLPSGSFCVTLIGVRL